MEKNPKHDDDIFNLGKEPRHGEVNRSAMDDDTFQRDQKAAPGAAKELHKVNEPNKPAADHGNLPFRSTGMPSKSKDANKADDDAEKQKKQSELYYKRAEAAYNEYNRVMGNVNCPTFNGLRPDMQRAWKFAVDCVFKVKEATEQ